MGSQEDTETGFCTGFDSPGNSQVILKCRVKKISVIPSKFSLGEIQNHKSFILCTHVLERVHALHSGTLRTQSRSFESLSETRPKFGAVIKPELTLIWP